VFVCGWVCVFVCVGVCVCGVCVGVCVCVCGEGGLKIIWCASVDHLISVPHSRVFLEKLTVT
jgi:hypothetical protein